jgi:hypothetical protein
VLITGYIYTQFATTKHKAWVAWYLARYSLHALLHGNARDVPALTWRAVKHDLSKYRWDEASYFARQCFTLKQVTYGSPEYKGLLDTIRPAIERHQQRNSHHPEYWGSVEKMPRLDRIEMVCDWRAASRRTNNGSIAASLDYGKKRWGYSADTDVELRGIATDAGIL